MARLGLSATLAVLLTVGAAQSAPAAEQQRVRGFAVTWPVSSGETVQGGSVLRLVVRPTRSARRPARVVVRSLTDRRKLKSAIVRRSAVRRTVAIRPAAGSRYRIRLTVGGRSAHRTFATAPAPPRFCGHDSPSPSGTLTVDRATARAGETVALTLRNTGSECLRTSALVALRREDGTRVPLNRPFTAEVRLLQPGSADSDLFELPADLPPGIYDLVKTLWSGPDDAEVAREVTATVTITP